MDIRKIKRVAVTDDIAFICKYRVATGRGKEVYIKMQISNKEVDVPIASLVSSAQFLERIGRFGIIYSATEGEKIYNMIRDAYTKNGHTIATISNNESLGWAKDFSYFILGDWKIENGTAVGHLTDNMLIANSNPIGSQEKWSDAVSKLYADDQIAQIAIVTALSAPLYYLYPNNVYSVILSLYGTAGTGKSMILNIAQGVWGTPAMLIQSHDTRNALLDKLSAYRHIGGYIDEVTTLSPRDVSELCYTITSGQERSRASVGGAKHEAERWCQPVITTSNNPLTASLSRLRNVHAQQSRIIELAYCKPHDVDYDVMQLLDVAREQTGVAGFGFVKYLTTLDLNDLQIQLRTQDVALAEELGVLTNYRYYYVFASRLLTTFDLASQCGIIRGWDYDKFRKVLMETLRANVRGVATTALIDTQDVGVAMLTKFLSAHEDFTIKTDMKGNIIKNIEEGAPLYVRYINDNIYIDYERIHSYVMLNSEISGTKISFTAFQVLVRASYAVVPIDFDLAHGIEGMEGLVAKVLRLTPKATINTSFIGRNVQEDINARVREYRRRRRKEESEYRKHIRVKKKR